MKEFICIECPKGCHLKVDDELNVTGNTCPRGLKYAINEITCPKRVITSTVVIKSKLVSRLPVMSENELPKEKMFDVVNEIAKIRLEAPVKCRDVIIENVCDTGVNIIATRTIDE
jgi:CxxC motif-containing protein